MLDPTEDRLNRCVAGHCFTSYVDLDSSAVGFASTIDSSACSKPVPGAPSLCGPDSLGLVRPDPSNGSEAAISSRGAKPGVQFGGHKKVSGAGDNNRGDRCGVCCAS